MHIFATKLPQASVSVLEQGLPDFRLKDVKMWKETQIRVAQCYMATASLSLQCATIVVISFEN